MTFLDEPLFKKPKWLKPELDRPWYYVHIIILVLVVTAILQSQWNIHLTRTDIMVKLGIALIIADGVAHTLLGRD